MVSEMSIALEYTREVHHSEHEEKLDCDYIHAKVLEQEKIRQQTAADGTAYFKRSPCRGECWCVAMVDMVRIIRFQVIRVHECSREC